MAPNKVDPKAYPIGASPGSYCEWIGPKNITCNEEMKVEYFLVDHNDDERLTSIEEIHIDDGDGVFDPKKDRRITPAEHNDLLAQFSLRFITRSKRDFFVRGVIHTEFRFPLLKMGPFATYANRILRDKAEVRRGWHQWETAVYTREESKRIHAERRALGKAARVIDTELNYNDDAIVGELREKKLPWGLLRFTVRKSDRGSVALQRVRFDKLMDQFKENHKITANVTFKKGGGRFRTFREDRDANNALALRLENLFVEGLQIGISRRETISRLKVVLGDDTFEKLFEDFAKVALIRLSGDRKMTLSELDRWGRILDLATRNVSLSENIVSAKKSVKKRVKIKYTMAVREYCREIEGEQYPKRAYAGYDAIDRAQYFDVGITTAGALSLKRKIGRALIK